ncbi:HAD-like protein [Fimicolochytrium jonesii]|uniref:HAD-like protein n=1 Tax=Fimicolochytrium jonesii TaxID=1396493 RepID=UPI0022FE65B3|nr:HAD-like protein [Fimicolochytrium jonesii]KAI8816964.1 HAD-like protein [Fimicolochytrium jonesii]
MKAPRFKAVFFDMGGVCVHSPLEGIRTFERQNGIPENYLNVAISVQGEHGAFQKLERGELKLSEFYPEFGRQCSDHATNAKAYVEYLVKKGGERISEDQIPQITVDGKELFTFMMEEAQKPDLLVLNAVRKLKESKRFKIAALTNNFQSEETPTADPDSAGQAFGRPPAELVALFDEYIESSLVGMRKPDPEIFRYACDRMGVQPSEAIMLDDIGPNLKAAKDVGMTPIRVYVGRSKEAIEELEKLVGMSLLESREPSNSRQLRDRQKTVVESSPPHARPSTRSTSIQRNSCTHTRPPTARYDRSRRGARPADGVCRWT